MRHPLTRSTPVAAVGALAVALVLAACGSGGDHDMGPTPSPPPATSTSATTATPAVGAHGDADVTFAQMMVPHHRQAVEMADMILAKPGTDPEVATLAAQIKAAQTPEIDRMTGWLTGWGQSVAPSMDMGHDMGGTMSQAEMDALGTATGTDATRLFLTGMIKHHQGAVAMADDELANGQNPDALELATSIKASQQLEIATMNQLLATRT